MRAIELFKVAKWCRDLIEFRVGGEGKGRKKERDDDCWYGNG
jgi:hypothetical protein